MGDFFISGFSDEISPDLDAQIEVLKKLNMSYMEIRGINGKSIVEHTLDEVKEISKKLKSNNIKVSAIGSPIGKTKITDDFDGVLKCLKHTKEIAKILETQYIRVFSFFIDEDENADDYENEVIERYKKMVSVLEDSSIALLHENERNTYGDIPRRCKHLFSSINSPHLKGLIDIGNFVLCGVEDVNKAMIELLNDIVYVHVKDAAVGKAYFVPIGQGEGNAKEVLKTLSTNNRDYILSLEPHLGYLPISGEEQFTMAYDALRTLLNDL